MVRRAELCGMDVVALREKCKLSGDKIILFLPGS
jgi:hypothetical protein